MAVRKLTTSRLTGQVWYKSMLAGNAAFIPVATGYELLTSTILGSNQTNIDFTNLSSTYGSTYQHLQIRAVARGARSAAEDDLRIRLNGDTATNYAYHWLKNGAVEVQNTQAQMIFNGMTIAASQTADSFSSFIIDILDPFETTKFKTIKVYGGYTGNLANSIFFGSGLHRSTSALSTFRLYNGFGDFLSGSRFSLYGLRNA